MKVQRFDMIDEETGILRYNWQNSRNEVNDAITAAAICAVQETDTILLAFLEGRHEEDYLRAPRLAK